MSGQKRHLGTKNASEVFLTSSSLSFSSLSYSSASWDDASEINKKVSRTSCEDQKGKLLKASSRGSEMSCVTHVKMQPAPSPPSRLRPVHSMNKGLGTHFDPERIPASVFGKTGDLNWSELSNESLFSLRMSTYQAFRQSNMKPEEVLMSGEFLAFSPSLLVTPEDAEETISQVKETKSVATSVKTNTLPQKSSISTPPPVVSWSTNPSSFDQLYQAPPTKVQSVPLPVGEKKSKKRKKTRKSKKTKKKEKEKKKKNRCCIWSWLSSGFSKCKCNWRCCYRWRKCFCCCCCCCCCRGPKAMVL